MNIELRGRLHALLGVLPIEGCPPQFGAGLSKPTGRNSGQIVSPLPRHPQAEVLDLSGKRYNLSLLPAVSCNICVLEDPRLSIAVVDFIAVPELKFAIGRSNSLLIPKSTQTSNVSNECSEPDLCSTALAR